MNDIICFNCFWQCNTGIVEKCLSRTNQAFPSPFLFQENIVKAIEKGWCSYVCRHYNIGTKFFLLNTQIAGRKTPLALQQDMHGIVSPFSPGVAATTFFAPFSAKTWPGWLFSWMVCFVNITVWPRFVEQLIFIQCNWIISHIFAVHTFPSILWYTLRLTNR